MLSEFWPRACDRCRKSTRQLGDQFCSACWSPWADNSPLAQFASEPDEVQALSDRFLAARNESRQRSLETVLSRLYDAVETKSAAVVAVPVRFYLDLMHDHRLLYSTYSQRVDLASRRLASPADDSRRRFVDYVLWGSSGQYVLTAALSLDNRGLSSYGAVFLALDTACIAHRAVVLYENGYDFVERHGLGIHRESRRPPGYLAAWEDRAKLAIVKHHVDLIDSLSDEKFADVLLTSEGNRRTDSFLEVQIYGGFSRDSIRNVSFDPRLRERGWADELIRDIEEIVLNAAQEKAQLVTDK